MAQLSGFTPLATFLRPRHVATAESIPAPPTPVPVPTQVEYLEALSAARRFCAGLRDALDVAVAQCLREVAREVLGRELQLAQPDIAAIVNAALERCAGETVLCVRVNPGDLEALRAFGLELMADERLCRGDVVLVLRSGTIDVALAARMDTVLELWNA